jgi:2-oxo-4-hydroxy-4-carboxy-5-ureidoimidazoline decarboxylase
MSDTPRASAVTLPHALINALAPAAARQALESCCGSARWVAGMLARRPFASDQALYAAAEEIWRGLGRDDFLEAFTHHPRIGDRAAPAAATDASRAWSTEEQARAGAASADTAGALRALNQDYAARFGYIFIVCASGQSGQQILAALRARLPHDPDAELPIAAAEQAKITRLRLEKLTR